MVTSIQFTFMSWAAGRSLAPQFKAEQIRYDAAEYYRTTSTSTGQTKYHINAPLINMWVSDFMAEVNDRNSLLALHTVCNFWFDPPSSWKCRRVDSCVVPSLVSPLYLCFVICFVFIIVCNVSLFCFVLLFYFAPKVRTLFISLGSWVWITVENPKN